MKYQVLIEILFLLLSRKSVSAKYISERFEISLRTAYRYLQEIELCDIPVIAERGVNGGFSIADTFKLPASFLTESEFLKLSSVINAVGEQIGDASELEHIKNKLYCASKTEKESNLSSSQLIIDGSDWSVGSSYKNKLSVITRAIDKHELLEISYHDREGEVSTRIIEPHALALKQGLWYAFAYCRLREDFRLFKIGRIEYAKACGKFELREFDANNLPFNEWYNSIKRVEFEFEVDKSIKSEVEEWLGIENVHELKSGKIIASARLPYDKGLVYQIMRFGSKIKVVKPDYVKKEILNSAKELLKLYQK